MEKLYEKKFNSESSKIEKNMKGEILNNNNKNGVCCKDITNGCHSNSPTENIVVNNKRNESLENDNSITSESPVELDESVFNNRSLSNISNAASSNNLTDNLSYLSDNCAVEEIYLSDEELSKNSDDCIYAYRGADYDAPENRVNNPVDDETDFLEMDYDPDPASELEQNVECHTNDNNFQCKIDEEFKAIDSSLNLDSTLAHSSETNINKSKQKYNDNDENACVRMDENASNTSGDENFELKFKTTGAKRKKVLDKSTKISTTSKPVPNIDVIANTYPKSEFQEYVDNEDLCLDCQEKEFLSKIIGKNVEFSPCPKCMWNRLRNKFAKLIDNSAHFSSDGFHFPKENDIIPQHNYQNESTNQDCISENIPQSNLKKSVKFSNLNVKMETVIAALEELDVTYNKNVIEEQFNTTETINDVPELIVHESKKNCDYKKIIRIIRMACHEELDIKFTPDPIVSEIEFVEVRVLDIFFHWNRSNDLAKLKKLDKRFSEMNVLGKVINYLREMLQKHIPPVREFIKIPQYYRTGQISISKI